MNMLYTTRIQMQIHRQIQIHRRDSLVQIQTVLLTSNFGSSARGERHNSANHPQRSVYLVMFKFSLGRGLKNTTLRLNGRIPNSRLNFRNSSLCLHRPMSTPNWHILKILKFSGLSLPDMTLSTLKPHFLSRVYYDNGDCHTLCARA